MGAKVGDLQSRLILARSNAFRLANIALAKKGRTHGENDFVDSTKRFDNTASA